MVVVTELSQVGEARRTAAGLAERAGLGETERGTLAVVVTELATNLARYAQSGVLAMRCIGASERGGVEVISIDKGPGIRDLGRAMSDGYSSGGTAGQGLGAVQRMSGEFDVLSSEAGTVLLARVWSADGARLRASQALADGVLCTPIQGEFVCGDGWMVQHRNERSLIVLVDGLGHGIEAARAADTALRIVHESPDNTPTTLIQLCHPALRSTRGAAMAVAELRRDSQEIRFAGVGNISGSIIGSAGTKSMASHNGTVGHSMSKVQEFSYPWSPDACVIMHSDGLMTRWRLDAYPGLHARHPSLIASVLHRDFIRGRDDATVVVVRHRALTTA